MSEPKPRLTAFYVSRALGLDPSEDGDIEFTSVTSDSRAVPPGSLFIAIPGEKFDGHDFIEQALSKGAAGVVCRAGTALPSGARAFEVPDTLAAYRRLAGAWRTKFPIPVVAVAGAVGKTTTKDMLAALLTGRWPNVHRTTESQNGFLGIAMTLIGLRQEHGAAVIEIGIDEPGAMEAHLGLVRPSTALVTAVGPEHLEKLGTIERAAEEETRALAFVSAVGGRAIVNLDDPWTRGWLERVARVPGFDRALHLGYTLADVPAPGGCARLRGIHAGDTLELNGLGVGGEKFALPLPGAHNALNLLAAIAAARSLGLSPEAMRRGLASFKPAFGRTDVRRLAGGGAALCDYYNANPASVRAALGLLRELGTGAGGTLWACLGDMLELGPDEERFHRELAPDLAASGVTRILLVGNRMKWLSDELKRTGFRGDVREFETREELGNALVEAFRPGDAVLIKGSRGMRMEEVWKILDLHAKKPG